MHHSLISGTPGNPYSIHHTRRWAVTGFSKSAFHYFSYHSGGSTPHRCTPHRLGTPVFRLWISESSTVGTGQAGTAALRSAVPRGRKASMLRIIPFEVRVRAELVSMTTPYSNHPRQLTGYIICHRVVKHAPLSSSTLLVTSLTCTSRFQEIAVTLACLKDRPGCIACAHVSLYFGRTYCSNRSQILSINIYYW